MYDQSTLLEEYALRLAKEEARFYTINKIPKVIHFDTKRYLFIDKADADRLERLRKIILLIIEERRKHHNG